MNWFDEIMDDSKQALMISNSHKGIFIPVFVKLGITIIFSAYVFASVVINIIRLARTQYGRYDFLENLLHRLPGMIIVLVIGYLILVAANSLLEVGSISLYSTAASGIKPKASDFFQGIRKSFFKVLGGTMFIHLIVLILSPLILALFLIYSVIVGTLTAGWGITFLSVFVTVFLAAWTTVVVVDDVSPVKAIGISISLGKKHFWGIFTIMLANLLTTRYLVASFGALAALIAGWFIGGVVSTYFKVIILLIYKRKKTEL